ncbi:SMI1/KNR4 family protein [Paenibacillus sp. 2TAB26]|uniref:SMI1/KNR4 family protein n=1 Tax=Paenibacillus sp. 2TAB26 TaxID=3233005 RepID=UPI003F9A8EDF
MSEYETIIKALISRFNDNVLTIQTTGGETYQTICTFNPPASLNEIESMCELKNWSLPIDYKHFLLYSNGARLFDVVRTYGGIELFSIDEILQNHYDYMLDTWIPIANHQGDLLLIDSSRTDGDNYLFWRDFGELIDQQTFSFKINFRTWFERIILCQGERFWLWQN